MATPDETTVPPGPELPPVNIEAPSIPTMQPQIRGGKSAVSELHEFAVQSGQTLDWVQESECGPAHCKLFSMKVTLGPHEVTGSGRSKKIAKQTAAQSLLAKLQETPKTVQQCHQYGPQLPAQTTTPTTTTTPVAENTPATTTTTPATTPTPHGNPVSSLQQITAKHGLGCPEYQVVCENGPLALQKFDIKVKVKDMESSGLGRSKKTAKRNAAQAMLDQLSRTNAAIQPPQKRITFVRAVSTEGNNGTS